MKKAFLSILAVSATAFLWNCSEESSSNSVLPDEMPTTSSLPYFFGGFTIDATTGAVYEAASGTQVGQLNADGTITNADGNVILAADTTLLPKLSESGLLFNKNGNVSDLNGTPIGVLNPDGQTITHPDGTVTDLLGNVISTPIVETSSASIEIPTSSFSVLPTSSETVVTPTSSESTLPVISSATEISSSSAQQTHFGNLTISGNLTQNVSKNASISPIAISGVSEEPNRSWNLYWLATHFDQAAGTYTISGTVPDHLQEGTISENFTFGSEKVTLTLKIGNATVANSSSATQTVSSSSQQQQTVSSSSAKRSSSSVSSGTTLNFKIIENGKRGSGYATRYWDSCKPHCAWSGKGGPATTPTRTCHADGSRAGVDEKSACEGGTAGTCLSQIPQVINDNVAYAFAATPGGENDCGRCFMLTFNGEGKDGTNARSRALKGKRLIVMSSNIGYDVAGGQFDIMIPGGGVGAFNGCSVMGLSCAGKQYGGLLATCEDAGGGDAKIKSCLIESCNREYANNSQAKEGCLFMANWMNAASTNPKHDYVEVECPAELAAKW